MSKPITKLDLKQYKALVDEIQSLSDELEAIYASATRTTTLLSGVPGRSGGRKSDLSDPVAKMIDLEEIISAKRYHLVIRRKEIEEAIELLEPDERQVIRLRYMQGLSWEQVRVRMHYQERWIHILHSRALKKVQKCAG